MNSRRAVTDSVAPAEKAFPVMTPCMMAQPPAATPHRLRGQSALRCRALVYFFEIIGEAYLPLQITYCHRSCWSPAPLDRLNSSSPSRSTVRRTAIWTSVTTSKS